MNRIIIISFWLLVVLSILFSNNSSYPILNHKTTKTICHLFPQGWGFFTKDPKEVTLDVYQLQGQELKLISINNFSIENVFGFSRKARYIGYEFSKLGQCIPKKAYKNEIGSFYRKYPSTSTVVEIPFIPKFYPLDKEYVIYQYKIVPFSWINQNQEQFKPYLVARIKFEYSPSSSISNKKYKNK